MAYNRRNDQDGRVVGFKDGMPVYKKGRAKQEGERKGARKPAQGGDRKPRYNDRDRDGEYDRGGYSGKRTYNRKNEPRGGSDAKREDRYERRDGGYRGEQSVRPDRGYRSGRYDRDRAPEFSDQRIQRKSDELRRVAQIVERGFRPDRCRGKDGGRQ